MKPAEYSTARDMQRAMTWLRGNKRNRNERWTAQLEAIDVLCRRFDALSGTVCPLPDSDDTAAENQGMQMTPILLTVEQCAQRLNVSERMVRKRIAEGRLRVVNEGRLVRVHRDEVERYAHQLQPNAIQTKEQS